MLQPVLLKGRKHSADHRRTALPQVPPRSRLAALRTGRRGARQSPSRPVPKDGSARQKMPIS